MPPAPRDGQRAADNRLQARVYRLRVQGSLSINIAGSGNCCLMFSIRCLLVVCCSSFGVCLSARLFVVCCVLCVDCCLLFAVCYWLLVAACSVAGLLGRLSCCWGDWLLAVRSMLGCWLAGTKICCLLYVVCFLLFAVCCWLLVVGCWLFACWVAYGVVFDVLG